MKRITPRSTLPDPLFPYTTLFRSAAAVEPGRLPRQLAGRGARPVPSLSPGARRSPGDQGLRRHLRLQHAGTGDRGAGQGRSEEHTSELQSLMRISYAVFCLKKKIKEYSYTQIKSNQHRPKRK